MLIGLKIKQITCENNASIDIIFDILKRPLYKKRTSRMFSEYYTLEECDDFD